MVPTFTVIGSSGEAASFALRYRHGDAAVRHRGLPTGRTLPVLEFPNPK
jgi:hypothetical protein